MIQNSNGTSEFYYTYTDFQGSLTALARENGTVEECYAYSPWGQRINPNSWTNWLNPYSTTPKLTRGYTGHEHLDYFGIINMNGRIYDPYTAQFYSPDPYVQDGGNWLNYNRYSYCLNNPFKYTDPDGNWWFYVYPNITFGRNGIESIGISAGIGFNKVLSAGISIGYNFQGDSWTFTGNVGIAGASIYGGYDTKAGWIGGVGYGFGNGNNGQSAWNASSSVTSLGVGYSQNGGWNASAFGFQASRNGIDFNPTWSVGINLRWGPKTANAYSIYDFTNEDAKLDFPYPTDTEVLDMIKQYVNIQSYDIEKISAYDDPINTKTSTYYRDINGYIWEVKTDGTRELIGGITYGQWKGTRYVSTITLSRIRNNEIFYGTINHELTHAYINKYYYPNFKGTAKEFEKFTEFNAYSIYGEMPQMYWNGVYRPIVPPYLLPIYKFAFK